MNLETKGWKECNLSEFGLIRKFAEKGWKEEKNENKRRRVLRMEQLALTQYRLGCIDVDPARVNCISAFLESAVNIWPSFQQWVKPFNQRCIYLSFREFRERPYPQDQLCWCHHVEMKTSLKWWWIREMLHKWCTAEIQGCDAEEKEPVRIGPPGSPDFPPSIFSVWKLETVTWSDGESGGNLENSSSCHFHGIPDELLGIIGEQEFRFVGS